MLCVWSRGMYTAAAQAVNEVWEPEAGSFTAGKRKIRYGCRAQAGATIPVPSPGVFAPELSLGHVGGSWSLPFARGICADPSVVWS